MRPSALLVLAVTTFAATARAATPPAAPPAPSAKEPHDMHAHDPPPAPGGPHDHAHGAHGNPSDLNDYIARMEAPDRAAWQKPDEVIAALRLAPGMTVCDIGAGPGYFTLRAARAVGAAGHVFAVDVEARMLELLRTRLGAAHARNVTPVLGLEDDPLVPGGACDVALIVDTYHHFADGPAYLRRLVAALRPGGRVVDIDFHKRELPVGPKVDHKVAREDFLRDAAAAGLTLVEEQTFLPYQYFLVLAVKK